MSWRKCVPDVESAPAPLARHAHTVTSVESRIFVLGGTDGTVFYDDLHSYDTDRGVWKEWTRANSTEAFEARSRHTTVAIGHVLYSFGGVGAFAQAPSPGGELCTIDTSLPRKKKGTRPAAAWRRVVATGSMPGLRYGHCAAVLGKLMFVFSGMKFTPSGIQNLPDLYVLDTTDAKRMKWFQITTSSRAPPAGVDYVMAAVNQSLVVFGGNSATEIHHFKEPTKSAELRWQNMEWSSETVKKQVPMGVPSSRFQCASCCVQRNAYGKAEIFIFGGRFAPSFLGDIIGLQLDTSGSEWRQKFFPGDLPLEFREHSFL